MGGADGAEPSSWICPQTKLPIAPSAANRWLKIHLEALSPRKSDRRKGRLQTRSN